jgi:amidase
VAEEPAALTRREVVAGLGASVTALAAPVLRAQGTAPSADLVFASAATAARAIRERNVSSVELTKAAFARTDRYQSKLNAFTYLMREEALDRARLLDAMHARRETIGPLHGVPIHVKESFGVAGKACTWGIPTFRQNKATENADAVDRLLDAGAVLIGATNVPVGLSDWQSYNPIYGTTNNPWDLARTPGGSSGGSAAALAAGLGYLSMGSDIAGSLRVPAHFSGIYAHKPTLDLVSLAGHEPGGSRSSHGASTLLAVAGPMARSADDLMLALQLLGGPMAWDRKAWSWKLPEPRARELKNFRVGYVFDDPFAPVTAEQRPLFEAVLEVLRKSGARLVPGWPTRYEQAKLMETYDFMLQAFFATQMPQAQLVAERERRAKDPSPGARGIRSTFTEWQSEDRRRLEQRTLWQAYFQDVDVFLMPVAFCTAMAHDHREPQSARRIATASGPRPYDDLIKWIAAATLTGCPATAAPIGRTSAGLPVGLQVMGPFWEDATPVTFASLLAAELGGFTPPPAFTA